MSGHKLNENHPIISTSPNNAQPTKRIIENLFLVWLYHLTDQSTQHFQDSLIQLQNVVNDVSAFSQHDDAIDFLTDFHDASAFLVISAEIATHALSLIHDIPHLNAIYILSHHDSQQEPWTTQWEKIKGVYTDIPSLCQVLKLATQQCDYDSLPISFLITNKELPAEDLNRLEPSFMYTQLFKEILLEMENDEKSNSKLFVDYCRQFYKNNVSALTLIDEFEGTYCVESVIWWYTRECFIYRMLNRALRALEGDTIINMGFFIRDLHRQIQQLHLTQSKLYGATPFIVYRGQGLSKTDFQKLMNTKNGLMSFNSFLSTSRKEKTSLGFAKNARSKNDTVGVLFRMTIDPSIISTPFAFIQDYSSNKKEEEILFSMHAIFRILEIIEININGPLYKVDLQFTSDNDVELSTLTERMRQEIMSLSGWDALGTLLIELNQFQTAEDLYNNKHSRQNSNIHGEAIHYHQLGRIKSDTGDYKKAIAYYTKSLEICQKTLPANHPSLATCYGNIGSVHRHMGEYSKALSFYEKNLEICQKTLPANHPSLATCYFNMAAVYYDTRLYPNSLSYFEYARNIWQNSLPPNHPKLKLLEKNIEILKQKL